MGEVVKVRKVSENVAGDVLTGVEKGKKRDRTAGRGAASPGLSQYDAAPGPGNERRSGPSSLRVLQGSRA